MTQINETHLYTMIGEESFTRLVAAFYRRVRTDDVLKPMYPEDDFENAEARLSGFLIQRFGGPADYSAQRGHPRLRMRHAPFPIDVPARNRWIQLMESALEEVQLSPAAVEILRPFFHNTATFMINRD
jgi:hemoglobin